MKNKKLIYYCALFSLFINGAFAANSFLKPMKFEKTASDATFIERTENSATGYAPYFGKSAFVQIEIESEEEYINRMVSSAEQRRQHDLATMSLDEYCQNYSDSERCPYESVEELAAIDTRPTQPTPPTQTTTGAFVGYSEFGTPVFADYTAHNSHCTMPQRSDHFSNKILTSGQYKMSDPAFEKAMITTFRAEGGCVNDPNDSGGHTCYGISQKNNPEVNVASITRADAENIAHNKYYTQYGINLLPDHIRGDVFMLGWGAGPVTGIRRFCRFLGIPERDKIDTEVISAAQNYKGDLHNDFIDSQKQFYIDVSKRGNNHIYLKGWMNRLKLKRENGCHTQTTQPLTRQ